MNFSSKLIANAVEQFSRLPGVGKKTSLRYVLSLIKQDKSALQALGEAVFSLANDIKYCERCHNVSDDKVCDICQNTSRDSTTICVVEDMKDVMSIEDTMQYRGLYHVLGGLISPIEGVSPSDLQINSLEERIKEEGVKEVIFALSGSMEGETTTFYIHKRIKDLVPKISSIARGVAFGGDLDYVDELTLGRSIVSRLPYGSE